MGVKRKQAALQRRPKSVSLSATLFFTTIIMVFWAATVALGQPPPRLEAVRGIIAVDAGHGGRDAGARGTSGSAEKTVCLAIARELTHLLEPAYRIVLTRSDDYDVALQERTAIANHQRADLLVSLHTGASYLHSTSGITIYYYEPAGKSMSSPADGGSPITWNRIQMAHLSASRELATALKTALDRLPGAPNVNVKQAPLVVLQGADMPAVAIEVGYLTHPDTENALNSKTYQTAIARTIAKGVDTYLTANP